MNNKIIKVDIKTEEVFDYGEKMKVPVFEQTKAMDYRDFPLRTALKEETYIKQKVYFNGSKTYYYVREDDKNLFTDLVRITNIIIERKISELMDILQDKNKEIDDLKKRKWWQMI